MNSAPTVPTAPRRRLWPWVLGLCLTPFLVLGLAVASFVTLDSDARAVRRQVMSATGASWETKVQFSVGGGTLGVVRTGMHLVNNAEALEARLALRAIKHASVGVYELAPDHRADWSSAQILRDTDRVMRDRGWSRLVGVANATETVMIFAADNLRDNEPVDLCVAVLNGRELVVVSAQIDPEAVGELVARHAGPELTAGLGRHARL